MTMLAGSGSLWQRFRPSWPLIVGFAAFARAILTAKKLLGDPDSYLHVASGRWMLAHGHLPSADPFSHSLAGAHWIVHEWLSEVVLALAFGAGGWRFVALLTAACFGIGAALLTRALLRRADPLTALILVFAGIAVYLPHLLARAHILALPFAVVWCAALFASRDEERGPPFAVLPLMLIWANLFGGFMFGLALAGYLGVEAVIWPAHGRARIEEAMRWGFFLAAAAALSLLTPNGFEGFLQPFRMASMPALQANFSEWQSTDFSGFQPLELWILGPILLGYGLGLRLPPWRLLLLLILIHLALVHTRHADLLGLVGPLAVVSSLGRQIAAQVHAGQTPSLAAFMARLAPSAPCPALAATILLAVLLGFAAVPRPIERVDDVITPRSALEAAERLGLKGPVFNSEGFGGYLIFRGVPTFIDGRIEMYGNAFLDSYMAEAAGSQPQFTDMLARNKITWTLLLPSEGAIGVLDHLPGWKRVYADKWAVVHARVDQLGP